MEIESRFEAPFSTEEEDTSSVVLAGSQVASIGLKDFLPTIPLRYGRKDVSGCLEIAERSKM
jgi:hypothetical protein